MKYQLSFTTRNNLDGYRDCHIEPDWVLIYAKQEQELILTCVQTGTHSDLGL